MPGPTDIQLLARARTLGPYEEWLARPETKGLPQLLMARRPHPAREDQNALNEQLQRSATIAKKVEHQAILHCYGAVEQNSTTLQLFEANDGVDLERFMRNAQKLPPALCVWLALQVCEALAHAHSLEVAHGNLSPSEIFLNREGQLKVDFGLAKAELQGAALTDWVDIRYVSPYGGMDQQGDLYATASILWELMADRPYRSVVDLSPQGLAYTPLHPLREGLAQELDTCLAQILNVQHENPLQSARSLSDALTRVFYGAMDADEERDGREALIDWVNRIAPEEQELLERYRPTVLHPEPRPSAPIEKGPGGLFTQAIAARDEPVRPSQFSTEDVRADTGLLQQDSTWSPGLELAGGLQEAQQTVGVPQVRGLVGEEAQAEKRTEHVVSEPDHPLAALAKAAAPGPDSDKPQPARSEELPLQARSSERPLPHSRAQTSKWIWFLGGFAVTFSFLLLRNVLS